MNGECLKAGYDTGASFHIFFHSSYSVPGSNLDPGTFLIKAGIILACDFDVKRQDSYPLVSEF